uniref:NADH dehydrogenase [ubiquinone] 1 beta subcomplex subunit 7 n=1 Tax=Clastoptera arizonana TaxID=38151 RepID=A0A1B6DKI8_9HEMI
MGPAISSAYNNYFNKDVYPLMDTKSKFDPLYGFQSGREEKVMIATEEEMISAKLPLEDRTYCAHLLIEYRKCRYDNWPLPYRCHHEKHAYETCEYNEYVDRMKDFERERRLLERKKRIEARSNA